MYGYTITENDDGAWITPSDPDVMPVYQWHRSRGALVRLACGISAGVALSVEAVWCCVHDLPTARDRVTLDQRGMPRHLHDWHPVDGVMSCHADDCGATFRHGIVVHPPALVPVI